MKRFIVFLSMATMLVALGAPLSAQSLNLKANVPFEFMVSGQSLPAGEYTVAPLTFGSATFRISSGNSGVLATVNRSDSKRTGESVLIFHRYGDQYFLARIVNGDRAVELPASRNEKEAAKTASLGHYETVTILASL